MGLSSDLISQFVKATKDDAPAKTNTNVYGEIVEVGDTTYVKLDGSEVLTPINALTDVVDGDRVMVSIDNHTATVIGNVTSPSARVDDVNEIDGRLVANEADIQNLYAGRVTTDYLKANYAEIGVLDTAKARITVLEAKSAEIEELKADKIDVDALSADVANIKDLKADKADITSLDSKYVNIGFANIDEAAIKNFYAKFGLMEDVTISNGTVTGKLVGVTINGDLIQAGTLVADKLVIRTEDGLLYKLNSEALGEAGLAEVEDLETLKEGLHGAIINDKTIVAEKISVDDLVAFGATIGGFKIESDSIHSVVKDSVNNTTRGIYLDNDGQFNVGDTYNFIKFYKDTDGNYKLVISADSMIFSSSHKNIETVLDEIANSSISSVDVEYYNSTSATELSGGSWATTAPTWENGKYIWSRTKTTNAEGSVSYSNPVCITGNTGAAGKDGKDGANGSDGRSVGSIVNYYMVSSQDSGITTMNRAWDTTIPKVTSIEKYLWNYEKIFDTDNNLITQTDPCIIGVYGDTGADGKDGTNGSDGAPGADGKDGVDGRGIASITEYYQITSTTTAPTHWLVSVPAMTSTNKYLWNFETITYTDGTSTDSKKRIIGVYGDTGAKGQNGTNGAQGEQGIGVTSIVEQYYLSTSETELAGGDWVNEQPAWYPGSYIWTRSYITWSDDTTSTTTPILAEAVNDANANAANANATANDAAAKADDAAAKADDAAAKADDAAAKADDVEESVTEAYSEIAKLNEAIKNMVVDKDGSTLMVQTADGWQFNFGSFQSILDDISKRTAYVNVVENDDGDPSIELGKSDSENKVVITNTTIDFKVGSDIPTKITNDGLKTGRATIDTELAIGNFVLKKRSNNNLGLLWKGAGS